MLVLGSFRCLLYKLKDPLSDYEVVQFSRITRFHNIQVIGIYRELIFFVWLVGPQALSTPGGRSFPKHPFEKTTPRDEVLLLGDQARSMSEYSYHDSSCQLGLINAYNQRIFKFKVLTEVPMEHIQAYRFWV